MSTRYVEVTKYVKELLESGILPITAVKNGCILARDGVVGEQIETWSEKDGEACLERVSSVTLDPKTGKPGHVVTKATKTGEAIVDKHGHTNDWIIDDSVFQRKYVAAPERGQGVYIPAGGPQIFIEIQEDITIHQWGEEMTIGKGGYINITNVDDMYGISARDFTDTYEIIQPSVKSKTKRISL